MSSIFPELVKAAQKKRHKAEKAKIRQIQKLLPEFKRVIRLKRKNLWHSYLRRKRIALLPNTLTEIEWIGILIHYHYACAYCGAKGKLIKEHVIPVVQGGGYTKENIVPACKSCNSYKGGRTPEQCGLKIKKISP